MEGLVVYVPPHPLKRVGKDNDGGYLICDLPGSYDLFISGGISNDISFESHFCSLFPETQCFAFDGTIDQLPVPDSRITFVKKNLGKFETLQMTTLRSYMEGYSDIFLKMDIEGHEFRVLPEIFDKFKTIKQLVVEIHTPGDMAANPWYFTGLDDINHDTMFSLFASINKTHTLIHFHANNGCLTHAYQGVALPNVFECTFVRNEYVTTKVKNTDPFPRALDMPNLPWKPDYIVTTYPFVSDKPKVAWYYIYSQRYLQFHEYLQKKINKNVYTLTALFVDQSVFDEHLYKHEGEHFFSRITVKVDAIIKIIEHRLVRDATPFFFSDCDIMIGSLVDTLPKYLNDPADILFHKETRESETVNPGFMRIHTNEKTLAFWKRIRDDIIQNNSMEMTSINNLLKTSDVTYNVFSHIDVCSTLTFSQVNYGVCHLIASAQNSEADMNEKLFCTGVLGQSLNVATLF